MCRLFGLNASPYRVHARFWLLDAQDSLMSQSLRNPDGTGFGYFDEHGTPTIHKEALPAFGDSTFMREAKHITSTLFVAHIRHATTGPTSDLNCHPFTMDGRIFAHNGVIGDLPALDRRLGPDLERVRGQTDSERYFALLCKEIRAHQGDIRAGFEATVRFIVANLPLVSLNCLLATHSELWAFRYPETDPLFVLERSAGGISGHDALNMRSARLHVDSAHLARHPSVVIASEPLDTRHTWRALRSGELLHVTSDLRVHSHTLVTGPPPHRLSLPSEGAEPRARA